MLQGIAVSEGIGLGKVLLLQEHTIDFSQHNSAGPAAEHDRLRQTIQKFIQATAGQVERLRQRAGTENSRILQSHIEIVNDPVFLEDIENLISQGLCAEAALKQVCGQYVDIFLSSHDELTRLRAEDIRDVCDSLLRALLGIQDPGLGAAPKGTILVAGELNPSLMSSIDTERIVGIILEKGGLTSHACILARTMGLPAVCGVKNATKKLDSGTFVIVDGSRGEVISSPSEGIIAEYWNRREEHIEERRRMEYFKDRRTLSADGREYPLYCNITMPSAAARVVEAGGEGIGLFRTEYLFMNREVPPGEEEQLAAYSQALQGAAGRQVVIRTLDIGGDKNIPSLGCKKEENPFLGLRGIRWTLQHKDIFLIQLRALLRAGVGQNLRLLLPMISTLEELRASRSLIEQAREQLINEGLPCAGKLPVGAMIETPSAAVMAGHLAKEAAFLSIGSNDLTGYLMACDRGNPQVGGLYSPFQPAMLRTLRQVIQSGIINGTPVSICGEAASDPRLVPLLMSYGITGFSVSARAVPLIRKTISLWNKADADALADAALRLDTAGEVQALLERSLRT